jgi:hypothetical protein
MKKIFGLALAAALILLSGCQSQSVATLAADKPAGEATAPAKPAEASPTPRPSTVEKFEKSDNWLAAYTVTTQAKAGSEQTSVAVKDGALNFSIADNETYVYTFFKNAQRADVASELTYESTGQTDNGIALVCRAKDDHSTWYEARVSLAGLYHIFKYDKSLKDQGQNPYQDLKTGTAPKGTLQPLKPNSFKFICKGQDLTLDINGGKFTASVQNADLTADGQVGIGGMSYSALPVQLKVSSFALSTP